jgi:hypothetical protein
MPQTALQAFHPRRFRNFDALPAKQNRQPKPPVVLASSKILLV